MLMKRLLNKETVIESLGIVMLFTILERVIQVGRGVVFARLLGPSEYGVYTLAFFFIPIITALAKLGIPSCYERYIPQYEKEGRLVDFLKRNYILTVISGIIFTLLCIVFSGQISKGLYDSVIYKDVIFLCGLTIVFSVLYENFLYSFNGLRVFKMGVFLKFSQFLIFTVMGIALVVFFPRAQATILANLVSYIFVIAIFGFIIWRYILNSRIQKTKIQRDGFYRKMFRYSAWFVITPVIFSLFSYTDRWMLSRFLGLHDVGVYSVACNLAGFIFMFGMIAGYVLMPNLSKVWEEGKKDKVMFIMNFALKVSVFILFAGAMLMSLFKRQIISGLYGKEYMGGLAVLNILLIFRLFASMSDLIRRHGELMEKTYFPFIAGIIGLPLNAILNFILIPRYKILGAAVATTFTCGVMLLLLFILNMREGLRIEAKTFLVCLLPFALLLNTIAMLFVFLGFLLAVIFTDIIITKEEKILFSEQVQKTLVHMKSR